MDNTKLRRKKPFSGLKVTIQALGRRDGRRYLPLKDDISAAAFRYQDRPALLDADSARQGRS